MHRIQVEQGKAIQNLYDGEDFSGKVNSLLDDIKLQKEQNGELKKKVYETEKNNRVLHTNVKKLEETIREIKSVTAQQKKQVSQAEKKTMINRAE